jgi:hypothetical protein
MKIIFSGSEDECFALEAKMRPVPYMGLNIAVGGRGGYTTYTPERNKKISETNKGKIRTPEHCKALSESLKNGARKGKKNSQAKKWLLISPTNEEFVIEGNLFPFCEERKLLTNTLRWYINSIVPEISPKYRQKSEESLIMRRNTTGWSLKELDKSWEV